MEDGRLDNQLNLALTLPKQQLEKSEELSVGYNPEEKSWEVIVKYNSSLDLIREELGARVTELLNEYAILVIEESKIEQLSNYPEIEFIEKPKSLYFEVTEGIAASCVPPLWEAPNGLSGKNVLVAIIDSGIDYSHPDFRNEDGTTRILYLWDQTGIAASKESSEPLEVESGILYTSEDINRALLAGNRMEQLKIVDEIDPSGHGTHVAGIACGNGRASRGINRGVAYESTMLIVKLGSSVSGSFPKTTQLMTAVDFSIRTAIRERLPLVINISFGNNYGSHDGNSLLEQYLNSVANLWEVSIVVGTGNEGAERGHAAGTLSMSPQGNPLPQTIELSVGGGETSINVQLWKNFYDEFDVEVIAPDGQSTGPLRILPGKQEYSIGRTQLAIFYGEPKPINRAQELFFVFLPKDLTMDSGIWQFQLTPRQIVSGEYQFWLPTAGALNESTGFLRANVINTITIPSTAGRVISVGAYDARTDSYAYFSGRGVETLNRQIKPELVAPGVDIISAAPGGGYDTRTGTSMATPFVTGTAALLMQWGIVQGRDPYLYGEKLKAYLIRGARHLPGFTQYPNPQVGFGALCAKNSLPVS